MRPKIRKGFTTKQLERLTGVSARKLRWWDLHGLVKPTDSPNRGRAERRLYSLQDVICVLMIRDLRNRGISLQRIRESVKNVRERGIGNPLAELRVACLATSLGFRDDQGYYDPISGQKLIDEVIEEIRPHLKELRLLTPTTRVITNASRDFRKVIVAF